METVHLTISMLRAHVQTEDIIQLMHDLLCFVPTGFRSSRKQFKRIGSKNFWEQLRMNLEQDKRYQMEMRCGYRQWLLLRYHPVTDVLWISLQASDENRNIFSETEAVVHAIAQSHAILSAALRTDAEFHWNFYGGDRNIQQCQAEHPELAEIRTVKIARDDCIDDTQFSGYTTHFEGIWFGCSYEMWFGADYAAYIPLNMLASFTDCAGNETLDNGTVHIVMYDAPDAYHTAESVSRAWSFRAYTGYDAAAVRCKEEIAQSPAMRAAANMVIESGSFPHGGIRRVITFLNADGKPVTRGEAAQMHISERGTDGKAISEWIEPYSET